MEVLNGVELDYKEGKVVVSVAVAAMVIPAVDALKAKIEAGDVDLIKGTDLDKEILLKAIDYIKAELVK
jgi:hypothetical protein